MGLCMYVCVGGKEVETVLQQPRAGCPSSTGKLLRLLRCNLAPQHLKTPGSLNEPQQAPVHPSSHLSSNPSHPAQPPVLPSVTLPRINLTSHPVITVIRPATHHPQSPNRPPSHLSIQPPDHPFIHPSSGGDRNSPRKQVRATGLRAPYLERFNIQRRRPVHDRE